MTVLWVLPVVAVSTIVWAAFDRRELRRATGRPTLGGISTQGWIAGQVVAWPVFFPWYLVRRHRMLRSRHPYSRPGVRPAWFQRGYAMAAWVLAVVLLAGVLLLVGPSGAGAREIPVARVESLIASWLLAHHIEATAVRCPGPQPAEVGRQFVCHAPITESSRVPIVVTVVGTTGRGEVEWKIAGTSQHPGRSIL